MRLIDQLLKTLLTTRQQRFQTGPEFQELDDDAGEGSVDRFEQPHPYRYWAVGFRTLIRLRYLALKKSVLQQHREQLKYDVDTQTIRANVSNRLSAWCSEHAPWVYLCTPIYLYSLLGALLIAGFTFAHATDNARQQRAIFENDLPRFADTIYRYKAELARGDTGENNLTALAEQAESLRSDIIGHFAGLPAIQLSFTELLNSIEDNDVEAQEVIQHASGLNDLLYGRKIPYYVSAMTEVARCTDLPVEKFLSRLFGGASDGEGDVCRVHALMSFHVDDSRYYTDERFNHLTFFTRRLDKLDIQQPYLGLVHIGDDSAQVLLTNIEGSSNDSLTAVNNGVLQSKLMPQGMPDVYGLESLARRLQSNVINGYVEDQQKRWWSRIPTLWGELTGHPANPLLLASEKLNKRTADVTAFHEVQHLVDHATALPEPEWFKDTLSVFGKRVDSENMREHILWELSAFFTHLAYGEELRGVLLNEFTAITLNPMLQDQPHFYSIRILLPVLHQALKGNVVLPPLAARSLSDVARAYKALAINADDLGSLARYVYPQLFGRPLPELREVTLPSGSMSRFGDGG